MDLTILDAARGPDHRESASQCSEICENVVSVVDMLQIPLDTRSPCRTDPLTPVP